MNHKHEAKSTAADEMRVRLAALEERLALVEQDLHSKNELLREARLNFRLYVERCEDFSRNRAVQVTAQVTAR